MCSWCGKFAGIAHLTHRAQDVLVAGAAAEVRRQHLAQRRVIDIRLLFERAGGQHQETGGAEAALQRMVVDERLLQRMQLAAILRRSCQALDRAQLAPLRLHREHQA